jgi:hypothetical protein
LFVDAACDLKRSVECVVAQYTVWSATWST